MKPSSLAPLPPEQLDELAAGLDAGWDTPLPAAASPSQAPVSAPVSVDDLDADWETGDGDTEPPAAPNAPRVRAKRPRPSTNQEPKVLRVGAGPLRVSKQERREAERQRLAHQAKQKSASKELRKAARQEDARRANEQRRAEQQKQAERRAAAEAKRPKPVPKRTEEPSPRRAAKQARREQPARVPQAELTPVTSSPPKVRSERSSTTFIIIVALALAFGACLWFALSRTGH